MSGQRDKKPDSRTC